MESSAFKFLVLCYLLFFGFAGWLAFYSRRNAEADKQGEAE